LRNTVSSGGDLVPILREYMAKYSAHYGLDARLVIDDEPPVQFSSEVAVQLSAMIQEALTNIRKHAHAAHAYVRFGQEDRQVRIVIDDDGRGFVPASGAGKGEEHFGLQIMRERAESIGGTVELDSQIGRGTRVVILVPRQTSG
jgi:two-component system nitrate/nitrite sensor histidine kinase NarX